VIERIFGVLKAKFTILVQPRPYAIAKQVRRGGSDSSDFLQVRITLACAILHNFLRYHDPSELRDFERQEGISDGRNLVIRDDAARIEQDTGPDVVSGGERKAAHEYRDRVAWKMWDDYVEILRSRGQRPGDKLKKRSSGRASALDE
jgi:hypothetical protein